MKLVAAVCSALLFASCASRAQTVRATADRCFTFSVIVTALDDAGNRVAPGVPIPIAVRSKSGRILTSTSTRPEGQATLQTCWSEADPPVQIEAALYYDRRQFVGTFASFVNQTDTYCLILPTHIGGHCGEWGTGPPLP